MCAIEKQPHAQGFGPLHGHQPHLPADMVAVLEQGHLCFVLNGIPLQARNPLFEGAAKPGTDFKAFIGGAIGSHGRLLVAGILEAEKYFMSGLKFFSLVPILGETNYERQITIERDNRNELSENETVVGFLLLISTA